MERKAIIIMPGSTAIAISSSARPRALLADSSRSGVSAASLNPVAKSEAEAALSNFLDRRENYQAMLRQAMPSGGQAALNAQGSQFALSVRPPENLSQTEIFFAHQALAAEIPEAQPRPAAAVAAYHSAEDLTQHHSFLKVTI